MPGRWTKSLPPLAQLEFCRPELLGLWVFSSIVNFYSSRKTLPCTCVAQTLHVALWGIHLLLSLSRHSSFCSRALFHGFQVLSSSQPWFLPPRLKETFVLCLVSSSLCQVSWNCLQTERQADCDSLQRTAEFLWKMSLAKVSQWLNTIASYIFVLFYCFWWQG